MKLKITLLCIAFSAILNAQTTSIPDSNFEQALIDLGIDSNGLNGNILNSDAAGIIDLIVQNKGITSLNGISAFVDLVNFNARDNMLVSANLTSLQNLESVSIQSNLLSSINLPNNGLVWSLLLDDNRLTSFNAAGLAGLEVLWINNGQIGYELASVNVQNNPVLSSLSLIDNKLTSIDVSNNTMLNSLNVRDNNLQSANVANGSIIFNSCVLTNNPNLSCVQVLNVADAISNGNWVIPPTASYSTSCSTLSLEDNNFVDFKLYPNPTTSILNIETNKTITTLELSDINGKTIYKTTEALQQLDMSAYNSGLYFLKIETEKGAVTRKVVKQ